MKAYACTFYFESEHILHVSNSFQKMFPLNIRDIYDKCQLVFKY